ncbi:energy transducer TonB [Shewanella gelidii]|uniref:Protein TonB n=1 Tax=Shewanella gelidii TaxID=1642821 RepID=A0A917N7P5_9GAMM|nr:energy transducer TonB [Shewanella gelidii]MCL1097472.1 energy transducer TonB [Shewanella gelidii]GGI75514.1 protein TonB [Shewanella gelidii]
MLRGIVSFIVGGAVTFALFVFMAFLVGGGAKRADVKSDSPVIEISMDKQDTEVQDKPRVKPKPPKPPEQPPLPDTPPPDSSSDIDTNMAFSMGSLNTGDASTGFKLGNMMTRDGDVAPIVRIPPQWPIKALRDGKEGWVQLSFSITETGSTADVKVIKAEPKRLFNKSAIKALKKWKYKPKIVDGKPMKRTGLTVQLDFSLDDQNK